VLVAATGNDGSSAATFPAGDRGVIGVASTDASDALTSSSNYGPAAFMAAPGDSITTTAIGGGLSTINGTSAAAASVAGAAALLSANEPQLSNGVIVGRLARNADPVTSAGAGNGRINLARAMADASLEAVQPAGAAPVGNGGPLVGPYISAAKSLTITVTGSGSVSWTGILDNGNATGGSCTSAASPCTFATGNNSTGSLAALPASGASFSGWSGASFPGSGGSTTCAGTTSPCNYQMANQPSGITATFSAADITAPSVTINQASGQADPTNSSPINFTVVFSESVSGFTGADVTLSGTAGATTALVTGSGTTYTVAVSGMANDGTVIASVGANGASDAAGNGNTASTSTDNTVTYDTTDPIVSLDTPADGSSTNDTTPALSGTAGTLAGDSATVTIRIYSGSDTSGTLVQTRSATRDATTGAYSVDATTLAEGTYTAQASQSDAAGNTGSSDANTFVVDTTAPELAITFPASARAYSEASWNAGCVAIIGDFCGTASDATSGLQTIAVSIYRSSTDRYWDGTSFSSMSEVFFTVGTASPWYMPFAFANFPSTGSYTIHARATDLAANTANVSVTFQINRYTIDYQPPIDDSTMAIGGVKINEGKNGRVIPVKVKVYLEDVLQTSSQIAEGRLTISVNLVVCNSNVVVDGIETYADAGQSSGNTQVFRASGDSWIYNLDTKALGLTTNKCYRLDVYLDGVKISTQQFAIFKPVK
jgi:hypothetical protein